MQEAGGVQGITKWFTGIGGVPVDNALQMSNIDDVILDAVGEAYGHFSELVRRAHVLDAPIPHLEAQHSWSGGFDAFGTKIFRVFRISRDEYICHDQTTYG